MTDTVDITPEEAASLEGLNAWPKKVEVVSADGVNRLKRISRMFTTIAVEAMRADPLGWKDTLESRGDGNVIEAGRRLGALMVGFSADGKTMLFDFAGLPAKTLAENGFSDVCPCR